MRVSVMLFCLTASHRRREDLRSKLGRSRPTMTSYSKTPTVVLHVASSISLCFCFQSTACPVTDIITVSGRTNSQTHQFRSENFSCPQCQLYGEKITLHLLYSCVYMMDILHFKILPTNHIRHMRLVNSCFNIAWGGGDQCEVYDTGWFVHSCI